MKNVILDADGVLFDYNAGVRDYASRHYGISADPSGPDAYDAAKWLGMTREDALDVFRRFNSNHDGTFGQLQPLPGAMEAVRKLSEQGRIIDVLSSCDTAWSTVSAREENTRRLFPEIRSITCIPFGAGKTEWLKRAPPSLFVEDTPKNALAGHLLGHRAILIEASHNRLIREDRPYLQARDWGEVIQLVDQHEPADASLSCEF